MADQYHARAARLITAALLILAIAALLRGCDALPAAGQSARLGDCLPGLVGPVFERQPLTDLDMAALRSIPALGTFWKPDGNGYGYFAIPADNAPAGSVRGDVAGGDPHFYDAGIDVFASATTPEVVYALVYADLTPDDPGAEHEGTHPCGVWVVDAAEWQHWTETIRASGQE